MQRFGPKEVLEVSDPSTYWLTFTNIALGVVTLMGVIVVIIGVAQELAARHRKQAAMERLDEVHTFHVPALGVTMADGGEPVKPKPETKR